MLVLLSFALVLVATVLLVLGLLSDDGLLLIYLSMGSSVLAGAVLFVSLRVNRPRPDAARSAPAALPEPAPDPEPERVPALVGAAASAEGEPTEAPSEEWLAGDQDAWAADDAAEEDWDGEVEFPIADYDSLTTGQILPLLPQLYPDEIDVVAERERATKGRAEILAKLDQLRTAATTDPLASYTEPGAGTGGAPSDEWFPIEDYESLSAAQIRPLLTELDRDELEMVRARELSLGRRPSLLDELDQLLSGEAGAAPSPIGDGEATSTAAATAGRAPAGKASSRRSSATKAPATRKAGAAKRAATPAARSTKAAQPARKAGAAGRAGAAKASTARATPTAKGTAAQAAPATKAAPAKKASATKASATKAASAKKAPATKAAPAKKAPATKAAPAKKATAAKQAAPAKKAAPAKRSGTAKQAGATKRAAPGRTSTKRSGR